MTPARVDAHNGLSLGLSLHKDNIKRFHALEACTHPYCVHDMTYSLQENGTGTAPTHHNQFIIRKPGDLCWYCIT